MSYRFFLRHSLVGFSVKILNSAIVIGLYYGFLTTFSIGPSYLFLIRAQVLEEGSETKISATTGFITGQLMMFISIYYAPFHLALSRPHTITFLTLPYLFFNFVQKNNKHYYLGWVDYGYKNPNSIRNFRIFKVFLNNLFFQLLNPLLWPTSILIRLMNIYLFRSNNKLLFLTSSFVGWLIGHIFLMKCIGLVLVLLQQKNSIKSKITMRFDKYILFQLRNYAGQIFVVFSFVIFAHYLARAPLPYFYSDEMKEYDEKDKKIDSEEEDLNEKDNNIEEDNIEEDEDEDKKVVEKSLVTTLFDYQKWNRPLRYIKNDNFENVVRDENSQFFFQICQSDGKKRISFTYPPDLSTFLKMMENKMDLFRIDKPSYNYNDNELSNDWRSINKEKLKNLKNEFFQRAKIMDKKSKQFCPGDAFEHQIRLSDDTSKTQYLTKIYDPFLNGRVRGEIQKSFSPFITNETDTSNDILINKIHGLLLPINSKYPEFDNSKYPEFEQKIDQFDRKLLLSEIGFFFNLMNKFSEKSVSSFNFDGFYLFPEHEQVKIDSEDKERKIQFLLDAIQTDPTTNQTDSTTNQTDPTTNQTIFNRKLCSEINEISKQVPRWSYNLIDDLEILMDSSQQKESQIRSAKADRVVLFKGETQPLGFGLSRNTTENKTIAQVDINTEFAIPNYLREPDYDRELIRGSMRAQRRKTVTYKLLQPNAHSPLFFEVQDNYPFFLGNLVDEISQYLKEYFRKPGTDNSEFLKFQKEMEQKEKEENKDESELRLRQIEEAWESILYGLIIRSFVLLFQSFFRKYILLPSLIITKNIIRILLFQNPEWSEDLRDWRKEVHIKCTYQGIPVSHTALPTNWFWEGIQIRILSPFVLKPWHNSKVQSTENEKKKKIRKKNIDTEKKEKNFWFLTGYGTQVESYLDDHVPNPFLFLGPILKKIKKQLKKNLKNRFFIVLKVLNERKKGFRIVLQEIENWNIQSILFGFKKIDEKKIDELIESKKNSTISKSNPMIEESPVIIQSITNSSFTEKRIKDLNVKTKTILKQIEKMREEEEIEKITEEKKEGVIDMNLNSTKTPYDAKRLELNKNRLQILKRRSVRVIRKSYCFFEIFMGRIYREMLIYIIFGLPRIYGQRFLNYIELTKKIVNGLIYIYNKYNKKNEQIIVDKTNQSIIPFMSIIEKSCNIKDMNSQNSCDVSSLSQAYVLFKLSQMEVSNGYQYKLRSIFESHGRSSFLKNEIKDYLFRIQGGIFNSKLRHKNRPDSRINQWTNWLKVHYQYALPENSWSRLEPQKWRNRIHEHRVAKKKDLVEVEYDSSQKNPLILSKKQQLDLLEKKKKLLEKKKIKKQYGYDLFSYQYLNYADNKKSYIYGYKSPLKANKNQAISYNYNTPKNLKELLDIMDDSFIQNYIVEDGRSMEEKRNRKYLNLMGNRNSFNLMGMNLKRQNKSIPIYKLLQPTFSFFSTLESKLNEYKNNPWIFPIKFFFLEFYGNKNITDEAKLALEKKEYADQEDIKLYISKYYSGSDKVYYKYGKTLNEEQHFLLNKYFGFYLDCKSPVEEALMDNINIQCLLIRLKNLKKFVIMSIKKGELDIENLVRVTVKMNKETCYTECRDIKELRDHLIFFIEPIRIARKNYEQSFIYQTTSILLSHKNKHKRKRNSEQNKDKKNFDLLVPENLLSTRRRRELRILICLNPQNNINTAHRNTINENEKKRKNSSQVFTKNQDLDSNTKKLMNLKFFLWPNYRFEDLACINRYWFDTHNGSRFSLLRLHMYPRLKI